MVHIGTLCQKAVCSFKEALLDKTEPKVAPGRRGYWFPGHRSEVQRRIGFYWITQVLLKHFTVISDASLSAAHLKLLQILLFLLWNIFGIWPPLRPPPLLAPSFPHLSPGSPGANTSHLHPLTAGSFTATARSCLSFAQNPAGASLFWDLELLL